jgi:hypothetical protein
MSAKRQTKRKASPRKRGWNARLTHTVSIVRGPTLKTLAQARAYILELPKAKQARWEIAVRCLLHAADGGSAEDIMAATRAIELAFLYAGQLPIPPKRQLS